MKSASTEKIGILTIVDLAGSERHEKGLTEGIQFQEAISINSSLSALGRVVLGLNGKDKHIPFRDSKLTRLLQNALSGNS